MKFVHGAGDGKKTGCLMTASNMLVGKGGDGDKSDLVCSVLRSFIIATNDTIPVEILQEVYAPLAEVILGTKSLDPNVLRRRAVQLAEWADAIPLPKNYVIRKHLTDEVIHLLDAAKPSEMVSVAGKMASMAAVRATRSLAKSKDKRGIAEACRDIIRNVALTAKAPVPIVNTELQKELSEVTS